MKVSILNLAIKEAQNSTQKFGLGAVIFKGSRIFGSGHNQNRSSNIPLKYKKFPHSYHAEIAAINSIVNWEKIKGASILIIRIGRTGNFLKSYPCDFCYKTLKHIGIKWIYYSNRNGEIIRERI